MCDLKCLLDVEWKNKHPIYVTTLRKNFLLAK